MKNFTEQQIQQVMRYSDCITRDGAISILQAVENKLNK